MRIYMQALSKIRMLCKLFLSHYMYITGNIIHLCYYGGLYKIEPGADDESARAEMYLLNLLNKLHHVCYAQNYEDNHKLMWPTSLFSFIM